MDMVDFDPMEEVEEDYNLYDLFPEKIYYPLQPLIVYRIKLLVKKDTVFLPDETHVLNTCCIIKGKLKGAIS